MVPVVLALASSFAWGTSDFLAGLQSRRRPVLIVLAASQLVGLALLAVLVAVRGVPPPPAEQFVVAAVLAGLGGMLGLGCLYAGLASGAMSVVAPISATSGVVPLVYGLMLGERPGPVQIAGVGLALLGVVLVSQQPGEPGSKGGRLASGVGLAVLAALGFGLFYVALREAGRADLLWALLVHRATTSTLSLLLVAVRVRSVQLTVGDAAPLVAVGILDVGANALYAMASTLGMVSLVSVLASLYPAVTVVLARVLLRERMAPAQAAGAVAALGGVALIAL
jgi:drug/metabolite transporter (DMT)-like permease